MAVNAAAMNGLAPEESAIVVDKGGFALWTGQNGHHAKGTEDRGKVGREVVGGCGSAERSACEQSHQCVAHVGN